MSTKIGEAMKLFGLVGTAWNEMDSAAVKAAWAHCVKAAHPDSGTLPAAESASKIQKLTEARDFLLGELSGANNSCKTCKGTGKVRQRLGTVACSACHGTGDKNG